MNDQITAQYRRMTPKVLEQQRAAIRKMLQGAPQDARTDIAKRAGAVVKGLWTPEKELDAILEEHGATGALVTMQTPKGIQLAWVPFGVNVALGEATLLEWRDEATMLYALLGLIEQVHGVAADDKDFRQKVLATVRRRDDVAPAASRIAPELALEDVGFEPSPGIVAAELEEE